MSLNQDLQATHEIISIIERSKSTTERIVDDLPELFVVVDHNFRILKGNHQAAQLYKCEIEDVVGRGFPDLFQKETWHIFQNHHSKLSESSQKRIEFELIVDGNRESELIYLWTLSPFENTGRSLYSIVGRDITQLRAYEKQLAQIFSSIPLGILTIDSNGNVESTYSQYTEWLLGRKQLAGMSLRSLLFAPPKNEFNPAESEGIENLLKFAQTPPQVFEFFESSFPKKFRYPLTTDGADNFRWLGVKYQPVILGSSIKKLLIVIEDRTFLVMTEEEEKKKKVVVDGHIDRILQVKSVDIELLPDLLQEVATGLDGVAKHLTQKDSHQMALALHGLKGNAKMAGLTRLCDLSHELESQILGNEKIDWKSVESTLSMIRAEGQEFISLARAMLNNVSPQTKSENSKKESLQSLRQMLQHCQSEFLCGNVEKSFSAVKKIYRAVEQLDQKPLTLLEKVIQQRVKKISEELGKKARVQINWHGLVVSKQVFGAIHTSCLHLINNALDHGIESPDHRRQHGKTETGSIDIRGWEEGDLLIIEISDDGGGIDAQKIKNVAAQKGLLSKKEANALTDAKAMQLIFRSGFSTASKLTQISGRGIGLDAVVNILKEIGGSIEIMPGHQGGTKFKLTINLEHQGETHPVCTPLSNLVQSLHMSWHRLTANRTIFLDFDKNISSDLSNGVFCGDPLSFILACNEKIESFGIGHQVKMHIKKSGGGLIVSCKKIKKMKKVEKITGRLSTYRQYFQLHHGKALVKKNELTISFAKVLFDSSLSLDIDSLLAPSDSASIVRSVAEYKAVAAELGLDLKLDMKNDSLENGKRNSKNKSSTKKAATTPNALRAKERKKERLLNLLEAQLRKE